MESRNTLNLLQAMMALAPGMLPQRDWTLQAPRSSALRRDRALPWSRPDSRAAQKCGLPGCQNTTTHNGGYCSADHCRAHKALLKGQHETA